MAAKSADGAVGGIDFGWRNPFAAVWGVLDRDDVLWITGERYLRETPLHEHAAALPQLGEVMWYADPAGRTEIEELRAGGLVVRRGDNDIRPGIAAVTARLRTGRLKVRPRRLSEPADGGAAVPLSRPKPSAPARREPGGRAQPRPGRPALPDRRLDAALPRPAAQTTADKADSARRTRPRLGRRTPAATRQRHLWTRLT